MAGHVGGLFSAGSSGGLDVCTWARRGVGRYVAIVVWIWAGQARSGLCPVALRWVWFMVFALWFTA